MTTKIILMKLPEGIKEIVLPQLIIRNVIYFSDQQPA
jgi:hypothetical protein